MPRDQSGRSEQKGQRNRLSEEKSPYLLQHADNPVDWYPWGDEAFLRATSEDKPIFLSIGYATCHWCHVMAHESFEDPEVASLLNRDFVAVKVDREERPDIDGTYMTICELMTGKGGWPLTIIMTPGKKPFFAATYIPKRARFGMTGLVDILTQVSRLWKDQRDELLASAEKTVSELVTSHEQSSGSIPDPHALTKGYENLSRVFDEAYGGFGTARNFPLPIMFSFFYGMRNGPGTNVLSRWLQKPLQRSEMEASMTILVEGFTGIQPIPGGGYRILRRCSTIRRSCWMPTQKRSLPPVYRSSERLLKRLLPMYSGTCCRRIALSCQSEDADSPEGEGAFYLWTADELQSVLGPMALPLLLLPTT